MREARLGRRYADGLYDAAKDEGLVDEVMDAMGSIHQAFDQIPELDRYWRGVEIPPPHKKDVIGKIFAEAPDLVRNFFCFLVDRRREHVLFDVFPALCERDDSERGIIRAKLETAVELQDNEVEPFVETLKKRLGGEVILQREVNPSLIAGFLLRYGNRIIDASVKRSIQEIRRRAGAA